MSKRHVRAYPKEFREQVVKPALSSGRGPREIAEEFEISVDSVRRWVRQAQLDSSERKDSLTTPEREELRKLRRDIRRVRMEREILANAAAWFAWETVSTPSGSSNSQDRTKAATRSP